MDNSKRACLIENDEEDEDGNLSSVESEPSMGENDEEFKLESDEEDDEENEEDEEDEDEENADEDENEYEEDVNEGEGNEEQDEGENVEQDTEENEDNKELIRSKSDSAKSKISLEGEDVHEDSSSFQPEDQDDSMDFDDNEKNHRGKTHRVNEKPNVKTKSKLTSLKTQRKGIRRNISKNRKANVSSDEDSDGTSPGSVTSQNYFKDKFVRQPTPLCDAILKDYAVSKQNNEVPPEKRPLRGSKSNNNSEIETLNQNQTDLVELSDQSESLQSVNKEDPISTDELKSILPIIDPLLVKKEESDIKLEIKEEISDENKDDLKPFFAEDTPLGMMDCDENQESSTEDPSLVEVNEISQCNTQNKRKRMKRKNEDDEDPSYTPKTKKQSTLSLKKTNSNQQEKTIPTVIPTDDLLKIVETQSATRRRGRPPKYQVLPLAERNKESENNLLSDEQLSKNNKSVSEPRAPVLIKTETQNIFNETDASLQPVVSLVACDALVAEELARRERDRLCSNLKPTNSVISNDSKSTQPTTPRKRGRPSKATGAKSPQNVQNQKETTGENSVVTFLNDGSCQNSQLTKLEQDDTVNIELPESNPNSLIDNSLKTEDYIIPTIDQENVFDNNDLLRLQQLDTSVISSQTVQATGSMTSKETNSFIADYLSSHQQVFDDSFFQSILPILSEILMLCMDEFTELLARHKKAANFTTEEFRQQELKLAIQSFCTMVSTYSEKFFPNFNSVMYKINQNKTKKGLLIALVFFIANCLCNKTPKFKGQIHAMRKMLMCMCKIKKINNPLFLAVLTTPEAVFNDELRLLVKILLVLQRKNVLAIPTKAFPETSSIDSIEETCELIISTNTNCLSASDATGKYSDIAAQFVKILQDDKHGDFQRIRENLGHILCLFKQNNHDIDSEITVKSSFEAGLSRSLTQRNEDRTLGESPKQVVSLDSLFQSLVKSSTNSNDDVVKNELDVDYNGAAWSPSYDTQSSELRLPIPADNIDGVVKVEEIDCGSLVELPENTATTEISTVSIDVDNLIPENGEEDPLSF